MDLEKEKNFYYSFYNKELVDKAFEDFEDCYYNDAAKMGLMISLFKIANDNEEDKKEIGKKFLEMFLSNYIFTFLHGATCGINSGLSSSMPEDELIFSNFRKNRDFCIYYDFGDNDFGGYVEQAANIYADKYNYYLRELDYRLKDDEDGKINIENLYTYQDLLKLEEFENIYKILGKGVVGSAILSDADYHFIGNNTQSSVKDSAENNYKHFDYLGINNRDRYIIGTYEEVEKQVIERHKHNNRDVENLSLKNIWINGEAVIIAIVNGEMKVWIR